MNDLNFVLLESGNMANYYPRE